LLWVFTVNIIVDPKIECISKEFIVDNRWIWAG
jgi:hypothetical protein